ncbi:YceD family protein [Rubrivirga sp.]|uniref:YceD family protein n=1 Tax=Rubrivirga sp. TaxID=1885344 RepID=UPI003C7118FF
MLQVRIAPLPDGLHQESLEPTADDFGLDPETFSDITVDLNLDVGVDRVLAAYTVRSTARLECDRTLDLYDQEIEGSHAVLFSATAEEADDDVRPLPQDATHIDVADSVRDTLLLAVPLRKVSPAARAAEIPTEFGASSEDGIADDRWEALRALRGDDTD